MVIPTYVRVIWRRPTALLVAIAAICAVVSVSVIHAQQAENGASLVGSWVGCDGRVVTFTHEGDEHTGQFVGKYTNLGGLGRFHFEADEVGYVATQRSANEYTGQVKWRSVDGNLYWKPNEITISGDNYFDNGSDPCARTMRRAAD